MSYELLLFDFVKFGEDVTGELLFADSGTELGEEVELVIGDGLLRNIQLARHSLVGPPADEEQFDTLDLDPVATLAPVLQLFRNGFRKRVFFEVASFAAAIDAAGSPGGAGRLKAAGADRAR